MPELPEVEHARRLLERTCENQRCVRVILPSHFSKEKDDKLFKSCSEESFVEYCLNRKLSKVERRGKQMWLSFEDERFVLVHFGMTGALSVLGERALKFVEFKVDEENWPPKFYKFVLEFENGKKVAYTDPRRFGRVQLRDQHPSLSMPVMKLGFDPYLDVVTIETFVKAFKKRNKAIKSALLDQSVCAGIGNWMADEILYQSGIHPEMKASELNDVELGKLRNAMFDVTKKAVDSDADANRFPDDWLFHHRWGKDSNARMKNGQKIHFLEVGGRTTAFVPTIQKKTSSSSASTLNKLPANKRQKKATASVVVEKSNKKKRTTTTTTTTTISAPQAAARATRRAIKSAFFLVR